MKNGHARSTAVHVSRHGSSTSYALLNASSPGLRGEADAGTADSADTGSCTSFAALGEAMAEELVVEEGLSSEHRGNQIAQSHLRYAAWQSAQETSGLYMSRPQGDVVSEMVKLVSMSSRGAVTSPGSVAAVCERIWRPGGAMGTEYAIEGQ